MTTSILFRIASPSSASSAKCSPPFALPYILPKNNTYRHQSCHHGQQQRPGGFAGGLVELSPRVLRRTRDCTTGAAGGEVDAELEVVPAPPLPGRDQSRRQKRQCARGTGDVLDDGRDELRVDSEPHAGGGLLDDTAKLLSGQRRGQDHA